LLSRRKKGHHGEPVGAKLTRETRKPQSTANDRKRGRGEWVLRGLQAKQRGKLPKTVHLQRYTAQGREGEGEKSTTTNKRGVKRERDL